MCGSSREHAPWALADFGFRILISTSFADIFRSNCLKNSLLPVVVEKAVHEELFRQVSADPSVEVEVDVESQTLTLPGGQRAEFPLDPFAKKCLLEGLDEMGYLLQNTGLIEAYEVTHRAN
ncbi:MAG: 3-isopropylmalate dehydratase small subunit [Desulfobacterales bacterium]